MRRGLLLTLDVLIVLAAAVALAILVSGGGVFEWHGRLVRAQQARNPLLALLALALLRCWIGTTPFLGRWRIVDAARRACERLVVALRGLTGRQAGRALLGILLLSAALKLWNVVSHYGFAYGDDVEVHLMTFSALQGRDLGVWDLRSPVYPLAFIYPIQRGLAAAGVEDPGLLIMGGRLVVVVFSLINVWLTYRVGVALLGGRAVGLLAALLLAVSRLHVRLGSTELPRTVASTFLLLAFAWLVVGQGRGRGRAWLAGLATGVAASLRFSEAVFAIPLALHLLLERRYRDLLATGLSALLAVTLVLGPGDLLFWPEMFFSLGHIVDFTLVNKLSSRGFEPLAHYLFTAPSWSNPLTLVLIAWGWRGTPRPLLLWALAPVLALSAFPHKEERYLVPVLPFLTLIAARGAWRLLESARASSPRRAALVLLTVSGAALLELEGFRFRRQEAAVDAARFLAARPGVRNVVMEEGTTTTGATLFLLPGATVVNLDGRRLDDGAYVWGMIARPDAQHVVLRERSLRPFHRDLLRQAGFAELSGPEAKGGEKYLIFWR